MSIIEIIKSHGSSGVVNSKKQQIECLCGEWLYVGPFESPRDGYPYWEIEELVWAEHMTDMLDPAIKKLEALAWKEGWSAGIKENRNDSVDT